ncbi:MAG: BNR-4 repeat-containing protein [Staphylococcus epidermidis]|nr:BNR-4 repeat-containing protein [Staphylococcus epidermidis]
MDAPKLNPQDTLKESYPKLNQSIDNANEALNRVTNAENNSAEAKEIAEQTQTELRQAVLEGDSSPLTGVLSVGADGTVYEDGPQQRLVAEHNKVTVDLATKVVIEDFNQYKEITKEELDLINTIKFINRENGGYSWWVYPNVYRPLTEVYDKTYLSFVNKSMQTIIASLDNDTGKYESFSLQTDDVADEHNSAAITLHRQSGRLMVAYTKHNSESKIYVRISTDPESITDFNEPVVLTTKSTATYAQLIYLSGKYHLFYRTGFSWQYRNSTDGTTWSSEKEIVLAASQYYLRIVPHYNTIRIIFIGHPILSDDHNIRYGRINTDTGVIDTLGGITLGNIDGTNLPIVSTSYGKVYDGDESGKRARLFDVSYVNDFNEQGTGFAFAEFTNETDCVYKVAKSVGGSFKFSTVCSGGLPLEEPAGQNYYFGGSWFEFNNDKIIYVARESGGTWYVEKYQTTDYTTWTLVEQIETSRKLKLHRPCVPYGGGKLFYTKGTYRFYTDYDTKVISQ